MGLLQRSVVAKLLVFLLLFAVLPLGAVGYIAYRSGQQSITDDVAFHIESVAILKEQEIRSWVRHLEQTLTWLATEPQVAGDAAALAAAAPESAEGREAHDSLVAELRRIATLGDVSSLFLLDEASGQIVACSDAAWEGQFRESRPYFAEGREGLYVSEIHHSLDLGQPTMVISTPVWDSAGQLVGVLAGHANLEHLSDIVLERSGLGETGETYLVGKDNLMLTESRFEPGVAFKKWVFTEGLASALQGRPGASLYTDYRGSPVIGFCHWVEDLELVVVVEMNQAEAFAPADGLRNNIVLAGGLAIALATGIGVLAARRITEPLSRLAQYAGRVSRGEYQAELEVSGSDEVATVASEVKSMVGELEKHRYHLEELVEQRSAETMKANQQLRGEIEEHRRSEEELKETMADLERSNQELEQFAYVASHDLQEPLRMVASYTQLLEKRYRGKLDSDADEFIGYAVDGANRMQALLNDLLMFSRVGTRGNPFTRTYGEAIFDQAMDNLTVAVERSGVVVTHDPLPTVMADEGQLVQLLQNLIDNAIKFRGGETLRIHVSAEKKGDEWVFSVRDNGIGIDPQYSERIFTIFQRLHTKEEYPGTGMGLAICKRIVERHNGRIWVESQPGEGATFYFTIPAAAGRRGVRSAEHHH